MNFLSKIQKSRDEFISIFYLQTLSLFHPSPFSDGKPNFYPLHLIGFHIKQTTPYLCPKPYNSIELSALYRIGKLFLHGDMPPCLVGYEWSYLFTSNGE